MKVAGNILVLTTVWLIVIGNAASAGMDEISPLPVWGNNVDTHHRPETSGVFSGGIVRVETAPVVLSLGAERRFAASPRPKVFSRIVSLRHEVCGPLLSNPAVLSGSGKSNIKDQKGISNSKGHGLVPGWIIPVTATILAGTVTYTLYSVRSR